MKIHREGLDLHRIDKKHPLACSSAFWAGNIVSGNVLFFQNGFIEVMDHSEEGWVNTLLLIEEEKTRTLYNQMKMWYEGQEE